MPQENGSGRTIAERAALRWPDLLPRTLRSVLRLPPGSRVRTGLLRHAARAAFEAWHRGDFELVPYLDAGEVETRITLDGAPPIGLDSVYYGPEGHCQSMQTWNEAWKTWEAEIVELIESGRDRIVVVARIQAVGVASGVELEEWGAVRYTFREGRIVRVDGAFDTDRAHVVNALPADHG
jgi:ketosteroid isomerase-like protein